MEFKSKNVFMVIYFYIKYFFNIFYLIYLQNVLERNVFNFH